jgi:uncharacterized membrane protein HdeD (DUF308 family)
VTGEGDGPLHASRPTEPAEAAPARGPRTRWLGIAAVILVVQGVLTVLYAGFLPRPPLADSAVVVPVLGSLPIYWVVLGALDVVAAFGVWTGRTWGRWLAVALAAWWLVTSGLAYTAATVDLTLTVALYLVVLLIMWRGWPKAA